MSDPSRSHLYIPFVHASPGTVVEGLRVSLCGLSLAAGCSIVLSWLRKMFLENVFGYFLDYINLALDPY